MKKTLILNMLLLIVVAALNASIFSKAEQYVNEANAFLIAVGVLLGTAFGIWQQIRAQKKRDDLKQDLAQTASTLIAEAKTNPLQLLSSLQTPPQVDLIAKPNESKNLIVATALQEMEPKKTKKLGLRDLVSIGNFVTDTYKQIKPLVKRLKD